MKNDRALLLQKRRCSEEQENRTYAAVPEEALQNHEPEQGFPKSAGKGSV